MVELKKALFGAMGLIDPIKKSSVDAKTVMQVWWAKGYLHNLKISFLNL